MTDGRLAYLTPEARARVEIDRMLDAAGWVVQDYSRADLSAGRGVAVREFVMAPPHGRADYLLFIDGRPAGVIEAKKEGETLTGVAWQTAKYLDGLPDHVTPAIEGVLPFVYQSTGVETRFTNTLDPEPASRQVFWFHRPATLAAALDLRVHPRAPTLRHRLRELPGLDDAALWPAQARAIRNLEESLVAGRPRALIQMATGSGKTFTAANIAYRLIKHADARRILFLVDRANLGRQTLKEFQGFVTPGDGRKFTDLYNVQHLASNTIDPVARVTISTIQRLYSTLRGDPELDQEVDEHSSMELVPADPVPVAYNPALPIEEFDVIIVDECHRSIFGVWRQVIDYFDAFVIGLTATPNKQAFGFFNQNLVMEYSHEQAVADGVNVDFDVYRIRTQITEHGGTIDAGLVTQFRDRQTRRTRWEKLDDEVEYGAEKLDRAVVARDQIRTVIRTFRDRLFTEIFPGRTNVPKTLIFAKDDSHADDIVQIVREEFGRGDDFAVKITYKATGRSTDEMIREFRNSPMPRIAVTVDMIATGTDVRPLECVFFMRSVRSRTYFEQMKGRGVRVIGETDFRVVTSDARAKERFVIVDAVGVTETDLVDTPPMDREPTVPLEALLRRLSFGDRRQEVVSSIAARLARLDRRLTGEDRRDLEGLAGGRTLADIARGIVEATDPDRQIAAAGGEGATADRLATVSRELIDAAVAPLASNPELRERIVEVRRSYEQVIDEFSRDEVIEAGYSKDAADRARATITSFERFIEEHRDEITALQVLYSAPHPQRLTFRQVKELAQAIGRPPHAWTPDRLWAAYEALDGSKVRGSGSRVLADVVSLVRFALHQEDELVPYPERVRERFEAWLLQQENAGRTFTDEQRAWLGRIRDHVAASLGVEVDDFSYTPFVEHGGLGKAAEVFGGELRPLLDELNEALTV
ncbi:type I restriction-modification enzyme R subunit C-terminal domain-containing protein [Miltoncostaea marina]|uniref:type I restriction endonuclease subunit R n=1 Tax=Miltoncostaea marina TaxID=2843215 RepID=UPI001C3E80D6|nr:type I restriction-modification enzyme R subunit C-terminal domain-containing protein [Miltoncostaea marina]